MQALHGLREQVRGGVAQDVERLRRLVGDDGEFGVVVDAEAGVDELAVDLARERGLGQAGADGGGDVGDGDGMVELAARAVGEGDGDHAGGPETKKSAQGALSAGAAWGRINGGRW